MKNKHRITKLKKEKEIGNKFKTIIIKKCQ